MWLRYEIPELSEAWEADEGVLVILFGRYFDSKSRQEEAIDLLESYSRFGLPGYNRRWPTYVYLNRIEDDILGNPGVSEVGTTVWTTCVRCIAHAQRLLPFCWHS